MKTGWKVTIFLVVGLIIIILVPFLFTQFSIFGINFYETGQIGDTVGGLTAPFISLIAAVLVYLSFTEQSKANQIQIDELDKQKKIIAEERKRSESQNLFISFEKEFDSIRNETTDLTYKRFYSHYGESTYKGGVVIGYYLADIEKCISESVPYRREIEIEYLLHRLVKLHKLIKETSIDENFKKYLLSNIKLYVNINFGNKEQLLIRKIRDLMLKKKQNTEFVIFTSVLICVYIDILEMSFGDDNGKIDDL